jgi:hypothetical protein
MSVGMRQLLTRVSRRLPTARREWVEAILAETDSVPGRWGRASWVAGAFPVLIAQIAEVVTMNASRSAWTLRMVVVGAVAAVAGLVAVVFDRYPQAGEGAGTVLYIGLTMVVLAAYLVATFRLTSGRLTPAHGRSASSRAGQLPAVALGAGLLSALVWTLGTPAGGLYHVDGPLVALYAIGLAVAFAGPPAVAGAIVTRRTEAGASADGRSASSRASADGRSASSRASADGRSASSRAVEQGIVAGAAAGMFAALANLIGGLILVVALPGRVPMDTDVLARHHTAQDILGANVGEDLVLYVGLLLAWPVAGALLAALAGAATGLRARPST